MPGNCLGNRIGGLGFTLSANNVGLPLLLGLFDDESRPFGILLGNLLLLDGLGELLSKRHVRDGDILERDMKLLGATGEVGLDLLGHSLTLGNEFGCVELSNYGLEYLISDGRENPLIIVGTEGLEWVLSAVLCY